MCDLNAGERNMPEITKIVQGCPDALAEGTGCLTVEFRVKRQHGDNWLELSSPRTSSLNLSTRFQREDTWRRSADQTFHLLTPFPVESDGLQGHADWAVYILAALLRAKLCCSELSFPDVEELCLWEQWEVKSKSSLMWGANSYVSYLFLLQVDVWFLVTQGYVHIFIISPS